MTGNGFHVNKLISVVGVANAATDVANLTDDNLENVGFFEHGVKADVGVGPYVSVRDVNSYYAKGTKVGFCIVAANGSSVLSLDVIKMMGIGFYRDGELVKIVEASEGLNASGLTLSLVQIAGSSDATMMITAEAPGVFDEISLNDTGGIDLSVVGGLRIKYAWIGDAKEYTINRDYKVGTWPNQTTKEGGITKFNRDHNRNIALKEARVNGSKVDNVAGYYKFVEDPEEGALIGAVLSIGGMSAEFLMEDKDHPGEEVFPAGTQVGFKIGSSSLLNLTVGSGSKITLYDAAGNDLQDITINAGVLSLGVGDFGNEQLFSTTAPVAFSGAKLYLGKGVGLDLGGTMAYYAYVQEPPFQRHDCPINLSSNVYLAPEATEHTLAWNRNLGHEVEFILESVPEGSNATISADGKISGIDVKGEYRVKAQVKGEGHENCFQYVTVKNDQFDHVGGTVAGGCATPLVNEVAGTTYVPSSEVYETSGALLSISDKSNLENITDPDYDNYAEYTGGLGIANDVRITGVKRADGQPISDGSKPQRIGFVVEEHINGLNAKILEFMQIRCYNKAQKGDNAVYSHVIDESNVIAADVIGTGKTTKVRYTIAVPEGIAFDEFQLWKSGVLDLSLSNLKIYYPFMEDADSSCSSLLGCDGEIATVHAAIEPVQGGGVSVGQYVDNISNFVDNDLDSYMSVGNTIQVGDAVLISVKLGKTIHPSHQVGIIVDNKTYLAGVKAGSWLKIKLRTSQSSDATFAAKAPGVDTGDEFTNWSVADANVAGYGDRNVLYVTPTKPFDEVYMEIGGIAGVTDTQKYYGICTRGDSDGDGIPDCMDPQYTYPTISGIDAAKATTNPLTVEVCGQTVTVTSGKGIEYVMAYDLRGGLRCITEGNGSQAVSLNPGAGISILRIELSDGTAASLKLAL